MRDRRSSHPDRSYREDRRDRHRSVQRGGERRPFPFFRVLFLILILTALVLTVFLLLGRRADQTLAVDEPYDIHVRNGAEDISEFAQQTADGFAIELTTPEGDVPATLRLAQPECKMLLCDLESKKTVYAKNIYQKIYPASLTKIMTAVLAMENSGMNEVVDRKSVV